MPNPLVGKADTTNMALERRHASDNLVTRRRCRGTSLQARALRPAFVLVFGMLLLGATSVAAHSQEVDGIGDFSPVSAYVTVGGENTQFPFDADNALGFDLGVSTQPRPLLGAQFRIGAYPISAMYVQMPMTGGYRVERHSLFGFPYSPFAYIGGGLSRSQDKGLGNAQYPPHWDTCWEAQLGFDRTYHSFSWRVAQATYRQTFTPLHTLRSLGLSTGIVYRFRR